MQVPEPQKKCEKILKNHRTLPQIIIQSYLNNTINSRDTKNIINDNNNNNNNNNKLGWAGAQSRLRQLAWSLV